MNFSKLTLFAAALLSGAAVSASAYPTDEIRLETTGSISSDISVGRIQKLELELGNGTYTLSGTFLSDLGSLAASDITNSAQFVRDAGSITISGGGSLTYVGGAGSGYYTETYNVIRGDSANSESIKNAWKSVDSFWTSGAYSGTLTVGENTTLYLQGQLSQYVSFSNPTVPTATTLTSTAFSGYAGVSGITLGHSAVLSFEKSELNMMDSSPSLSSTNPSSGYNPTPVNALNFINNLTSEADSTIVLGTDSGSHNRVVLNTDGGKVSTVGRLSGNGRFFTTGGGSVAFIGESLLDSGTETTGNTWKSGNRLADIAIGNAYAYIGVNPVPTDDEGGVEIISDTEAAAAAVDNVFRNATAVQISAFTDTGNTTYAAASGTSVNVLGHVSSGSNGIGHSESSGGSSFSPIYTSVVVYGNQVFNNFQSLWFERSILLDDADTSMTSYCEPIKFSYTVNGTPAFQYGSSTAVRVAADSVLTINQEKGRDGYYTGTLYTEGSDSGEGLVVKTGAGRFVYSPLTPPTGFALTHLRIEEGEWITDPDGLSGSDIVLAGNGELTIAVNETGSPEFSVQSVSSSSTINFVLEFIRENDLTASSLNSVLSGEDYTEEDLEYRKVVTRSTPGSAFQVTRQQSQYYGIISVDGGIVLTLGESEKSGCIFPAASRLELNGQGSAATSGIYQYARLEINGTQFVDNLVGTTDASAVTVNSGGTLVLTRTDAGSSYAGGFTGLGNIVNLGGAQSIIGGSEGDVRGTVTAISGSLFITQSTPNTGFAGLVLAGTASATTSGQAKVGALIGEKDTTLYIGGDLTVGATIGASTGKKGEYLATADYSRYETYFKDTSCETVLGVLDANATAARTYYKGTGEGLESVKITVADTTDYLKNPASVKEVFKQIYATTTPDVFSAMKSGPGGSAVFGNASSAAEWLRNTFTEAKADAFIASSASQLSEAQSVALKELAIAISDGNGGENAYLDSAGNLNVEGWNKIVAAGGLSYLKGTLKNEVAWSNMSDDSLYSFIKLFYGEKTYEFQLTERNAQLISQAYSLDRTSWGKGSGATYAPNYDAFDASFGVEEGGTEYAGTLMGSGNLIKVGAETLRLTGENSYTGSTVVRAGELHVNRNAIKSTSGISVDAGALFTITANQNDVKSVDDEGKVTYFLEEYSELLSGSTARLRGTGVVLKLGDGNVSLNNAVLDVDAESGEDFTGTFLIGEGGLKATVDAATRSANGNALAFDIVFSGDTGKARSFTLAFDTDGGKIKRDSADDPAVELDFDGQITDVAKNGTLILDLGQSGIVSAGADDGWTAVLNNILNVGADKFKVSNIALNSGTLRISTNADVTFDTLTFGDAKAELIFDLTTDASLSSLSGGTVDIKAGGDEKKGALVVRANTKNESTELYEDATLTLENTKLGGISSLTLEGGAQLVIGDLTSAASATDIVLTSLSGDEQTSLTLGENRKLELTVEAGKVSEFSGALLGAGTFVFNGEEPTESQAANGVAAGKLIIGNKNASAPDTTKTAFGGTIVFKSGTLELNAGENLTLEYTGLTIDEGDSEFTTGRTLVKDGAGTIEILSTDAVGNSISVQNLKVDVQAGELAVSGDLFDNGGVLPTAFNIESGATFRFVDPMNNLEIESLGTLSGTGTLAFGSDVVGADAAEKVEISVDSNITNTFTGVVYIAENVTLTLGGNVTEFAGFAGDGTVFVGNSDGKLTVRVNASADGSNPFGGTIENLKDLTVVGEGALVFGSTAEIPSDLTKITVGTASENGGIGVGVSWNGGIDAVGATSRVIVSGYDSENTAFAGTTTVKDSVENLVLLRDGTLALGAGAVAEAFQLKNAAGTGALDLSDETSTLSVTLGNIAGTSLTLTNLSELDAENFELVANANPENGYALVFSGAETNGRSRAAGYALFAATDAASGDDAAAGDAVWTKDISGAGGISVADGATLTLTSGTLSYTGATYVEAGSTLVYDSESGRTVLQTSSLDVAGTLQGGVTLAADNASIVFESGATYVFTGAGVRFTGTASLAGGDNTKLNVRLTADSLDVRGTPLALFEYVGEDSAGGKNDLSWNKIEVEDNTKDGVYYYKDESVDTYESGKTVLYIATDDLANVPGVSLHDGLGAKFLGLLSAIATPDAGTLNNNNALGITLFTENADGSKTLTGAGSLADAIIKTPNGSLDAALTNLSPLGYASMLALPQSGFLSDISAVTSRLEARRYDNYAQFIWETHNDWEFFVQAQGSTLDADDATDTRTFDMDTYGAVAGADVKLGATTTAGFSVAYDYGKADFRNGGGKVESNDIRATAFVGKVFCEQFYFDAGVQGGFASYDAKRHTLGGTAKGDTTGLHAGAFFNVGTLIPLAVSEDEATSLYLMPYVGLAYSYYNVGSFSESGASTALKTDSFDANSLRASIGASLALKFRLSGMGARFNFDFSYSRELLDTDADITSAMPEIFGSTKMKFSAEAFAQDVFSVGPRISLDLDSNKSIYAGYRFDMTTDAETAHSLNIGFRSRF